MSFKLLITIICSFNKL